MVPAWAAVAGSAHSPGVGPSRQPGRHFPSPAWLLRGGLPPARLSWQLRLPCLSRQRAGLGRLWQDGRHQRLNHLCWLGGLGLVSGQRRVCCFRRLDRLGHIIRPGRVGRFAGSRVRDLTGGIAFGRLKMSRSSTLGRRGGASPDLAASAFVSGAPGSEMPRASSMADKAASAGSLLFFCVDMLDHPSVVVPDHPSNGATASPGETGHPTRSLAVYFSAAERKQKVLTICNRR